MPRTALSVRMGPTLSKLGEFVLESPKLALGPQGCIPMSLELRAILLLKILEQFPCYLTSKHSQRRPRFGPLGITCAQQATITVLGNQPLSFWFKGGTNLVIYTGDGITGQSIAYKQVQIARSYPQTNWQKEPQGLRPLVSDHGTSMAPPFRLHVLFSPHIISETKLLERPWCLPRVCREEAEPPKSERQSRPPIAVHGFRPVRASSKGQGNLGHWAPAVDQGLLWGWCGKHRLSNGNRTRLNRKRARTPQVVGAPILRGAAPWLAGNDRRNEDWLFVAGAVKNGFFRIGQLLLCYSHP